MNTALTAKPRTAIVHYRMNRVGEAVVDNRRTEAKHSSPARIAYKLDRTLERAGRRAVMAARAEANREKLALVGGQS